MKKSRGTLSRTTKRLRRKEKVTATRLLKEFKIGEKVTLKLNPYSTSNPHRRFVGRVGVVKEKRGEAYIVEVKDGSLKKQLIVLPINMARIQ